jgi:hypothetical protein
MLTFDFIHPVASGTNIINSTLNNPYNNVMRGGFKAFVLLKKCLTYLDNNGTSKSPGLSFQVLTPVSICLRNAA